MKTKEKFLSLVDTNDDSILQNIERRKKWRWFIDIKNKILIKYYIIRDKIIH